MTLKDVAKKVAYRIPLLSQLAAPRYPYNIGPGQLTFLCEAINATKGDGGAILEIGVARGNTSVFLLEHLRTTNDPRRVYCVDTFAGFTAESIDHEVRVRGKTTEVYGGFRYGDEAIFNRNLKRLGFSNFETVKGDAATLDYARFGKISVVLLDIDLYLVTKAVLERIWDHMAVPGFICVDDCLAGTPWDGSLQAYTEFLAEKGLPSKIVGEKGGTIVKT